MPKVRPVKPPPAPPSPRRRAVVRGLLHVLVGTAFAVGLFYLVRVTRQYVGRDVATADGPLRVLLVSRPAWMTDYLASQVADAVPHAGGRSALDRSVVEDAAAALRANPYVRTVRQVRRVYGSAPGDTLLVDCDFRVPVALVHWADGYWLVDADGVAMPDPFTAEQATAVERLPDGRPNLRVIDGVRSPPPSPGRPWPGEDVQAALALVRLFHGLPYLDDVSAVDVTNLNGRSHRGDAQIVLQTRDGTQVRWGRPVGAKDFFVEAPVARKLAALQAIAAKYGRLDAGRPWVDVRFDANLTAAADAGAVDANHLP